MSRPQWITLLTDFGLNDTYVAQMKGVIYSIAPDVRIVDITHGIEPQNIFSGARALLETAPYFPAGTIHIAVVDPGVGTGRKIVCVQALEQVFILPNNGLIGLLVDRYGATAAYDIENSRLFRSQPSPTFHGRDIMAPVAAHIANGTPISEVGPQANQLLKIELPLAINIGGGCSGVILSVDRFGNLITNISLSMAADLLKGQCVRVESRKTTALATTVQTYGEAPPGTLVALIGSEGWLEISIVNGSAAEVTGMHSGESIIVGLADRNTKSQIKEESTD